MARRSATATKKKPRKGQQLELPRTNWGGRRRGAGRKPRPGGKTGAPHRRRPWHDRRHPVHVSLKVDPDELPDICTVGQHDLFRRVYP